MIDLLGPALPGCLRGGDWRQYVGRTYPVPSSWDGFCQAWWNVMWVRYQAIEREAEAQEWARELEAP